MAWSPRRSVRKMVKPERSIQGMKNNSAATVRKKTISRTDKSAANIFAMECWMIMVTVAATIRPIPIRLPDSRGVLGDKGMLIQP